MGCPFALQIYKELFISASYLRLDVRKRSILLQTETKTATGRIKMDLDSAPFNEPTKLHLAWPSLSNFEYIYSTHVTCQFKKAFIISKLYEEWLDMYSVIRAVHLKIMLIY